MKKPSVLAQLAILATTVGALTACSQSNQNVSNEIARQFDSGSASVINLTTVTLPPWSRVCVVGPYATNDSASEILGFEWDVASHSRIGGDDSITLLVFIQDKKVVAFAEHPRNKGDFSGTSNGCIKREDAMFERLTDGTGWVRLVVAHPNDK
jgi:hypothetical protein